MTWMVRLAALCIACTLDVAPLLAQAARRGDAVQLIVRPRVGDTLWLQLEQVIEVKGGPSTERRDGMGADRNSDRVPPARSPEYGPRRSNASTRITHMHLFAHSIVEASDLQQTTIRATTDSLLMWAGLAAEEPNARPVSMPLPAEGRHARVRVTTDGTMTVNDLPPGSMALGTTLASMPGMLPHGPIGVGAKWVRDIPIPSLPIGGMRADGTLRATLRLDSLTRAGRVAWISMEGTLHRDGGSQELPVGGRVLTAGTIGGTLVVDRVRGWITDATTIIDVRSEVSQAPGPTGNTPMLVDIRVTQRVRVR